MTWFAQMTQNVAAGLKCETKKTHKFLFFKKDLFSWAEHFLSPAAAASVSL